METIGKKLAALRKSRSYTQEKLSTILGVSPQAISKWESDTTMPDIMLLPVIAEVFDISIDELFGKNPKAKERMVRFDDVTNDAYDALLESMARAWKRVGISLYRTSPPINVHKGALARMGAEMEMGSSLTA